MVNGKILDFDRSPLEFELLDEFHAAWCNLHLLAREEHPREDLENAAQELMDRHEELIKYRERQ